MAQLCQITAKAEIQSSPEKFYNFLKYKTHQLPTILSHIVQKVELIEGEEGQPGNVKLLVYVLGETVSIKVKTTVVDDVNKTIIFVVVEGNILEYYVKFEAKLTIEKHHVLWTLNYEKANPAVPDPDKYAKLAVEATKALDAYLLVN